MSQTTNFIYETIPGNQTKTIEVFSGDTDHTIDTLSIRGYSFRAFELSCGRKKLHFERQAGGSYGEYHHCRFPKKLIPAGGSIKLTVKNKMDFPSTIEGSFFLSLEKQETITSKYPVQWFGGSYRQLAREMTRLSPFPKVPCPYLPTRSSKPIPSSRRPLISTSRHQSR